METLHSWRPKLSFKNATIALTVCNIMAALFLFQGFLSSSRTKTSSVQLRYIKESEEMRLAMQPWELIKRVKEIEQEAYTEPETVKQTDARQTAAGDLSKRLQDLRSYNDAASTKALEEWRKRKMERARKRELEKNGTATLQA